MSKGLEESPEPFSIEPEAHSPIIPRENDPFIPKESFMWVVGPSFEDFFRKFDDKFIKIFQHFIIKKPHSTIFGRIMAWLIYYISLIMVYATQIENGPSLVIIFLLLGMDYIASFLLVTGWFTAIAAQIPKRFAFRKRPYMVERAYQLRKDKTSSLPSRSTVCAVVFGYALLAGYNYHVEVVMQQPERALSSASFYTIIFGLAVLTAFSRVHLGVHYPSDCVIGGLFGALITAISVGIFQLPNILGCPTCYAGACYPSDPEMQMDNTNFSLQNEGTAVLTLVIGFVLFMLMIIPPLRFWEKAAPVFGSFLACLVSAALMECPSEGAKGLRYVDISEIPVWKMVFAIVLGEVNLFVSIITVDKYRKLENLSHLRHTTWNALVFAAFFFVFLALIIIGRLFITF